MGYLRTFRSIVNRLAIVVILVYGAYQYGLPAFFTIMEARRIEAQKKTPITHAPPFEKAPSIDNDKTAMNERPSSTSPTQTPIAQPTPPPPMFERWWLDVDLTQNHAVWVENKHHHMGSFFKQYDRMTTHYKTVEVTILTSSDTNKAYLKRFTNYLEAKGHSYKIEAIYEAKPIRPETQENASPKPNAGTKKTIFVDLKASGLISINDQTHSLDEFKAYLDKQPKQEQQVFRLFVHEDVSDDTFRQAIAILRNRSIDYELVMN